MSTTINLSQLAAPGIVEALDFETIFSQVKAEYLARYPEFSAEVESEPAIKLLETFAYREMILRQRVNDGARGTMLAFAKGTDLDQIGANFNVKRLLVTPANNTTVPPTAAVYESDDDYRARIQLSPEGYTTAGSEGSYVFHGLSASGTIKDVQAVSPAPGEVSVYVLSREGDGTPTAGVLAAVTAALNAEEIRPLTDKVTVLGANVVPFQVIADLTLYEGPDPAVVIAAAYKAVEDYAESVRRLGYDVTISGLYRALHQPGVQSANLKTPATSLVMGTGEATHLTAVTLKQVGTDV